MLFQYPMHTLTAITLSISCLHLASPFHYVPNQEHGHTPAGYTIGLPNIRSGY